VGDLIDMATSAKALQEKRRSERWHVAYGEEIAKPRPPIAYVCRDLAIAPGCSIFGGGGFGGKTTSLQALMLAIATGRKAWGHFDVERGAVAHIDFEQGPDLTFLKYQRMARSMRVDLEDVGQDLACSSLPNASFSASTDSADELRWLLEGRKAAIIDAFRGAFPEAQENDSGARKYLDMVHRVGIEMGCAVIVIAHARKLGDDADARSSLRGSSALFDAPQTVWMLTGARNKPTRCENVKERLRGKLRDDFGIQFTDELGGGEGDLDNEWGLDVAYVSPEDLQVAYRRDEENLDITVAVNSERLATAGERILDLITRSADGLNPATIRSVLGLPASEVNAILPELLRSGAVVQYGKGVHAILSVPDGRQPGED
jgi:hypothetical protein